MFGRRRKPLNLLDPPPGYSEPEIDGACDYCVEHGRADGRFVIHEFMGRTFCSTHLAETLRAMWRSWREEHGLHACGRVPFAALEVE